MGFGLLTSGGPEGLVGSIRKRRQAENIGGVKGSCSPSRETDNRVPVLLDEGELRVQAKKRMY